MKNNFLDLLIEVIKSVLCNMLHISTIDLKIINNDNQTTIEYIKRCDNHQIINYGVIITLKSDNMIDLFYYFEKRGEQVNISLSKGYYDLQLPYLTGDSIDNVLVNMIKSINYINNFKGLYL